MPGFELIDNEERKAVNSIFKNGGVLFAHGFEKIRKNFHVREFEKKTCTFFNCKHALAVTSGTAAIKIALKALNLKPGDEVITQAFNFIATIEAILDSLHYWLSGNKECQPGSTCFVHDKFFMNRETQQVCQCGKSSNV